mmetsp:Transcript_3584/g.11112  ORF Transcript_3584/g.11112 Transcript_3584/m.11112 type:complete len:208 (+) Transcript_3584:1276-1899(+)
MRSHTPIRRSVTSYSKRRRQDAQRCSHRMITHTTMSYPRARRATRGGNSLVTAPVIQLPPPPIPHARGRSVGSQIQNRPSAPTAPFRRRYPVVSSTGRRPTARRPKLLHVPGAGTTPKAGALRGAASHSGPPGRAPSRRWSREGSCTRATTRANGGPTSNPSKSSEFAPADYLAARVSRRREDGLASSAGHVLSSTVAGVARQRAHL